MMANNDSTQDVFTFQEVRHAFKKLLKLEQSNIIDGHLPKDLNFVGEMFAEMTFEGYETVFKASLSQQEVNLIERYSDA